MFLFSTMMILDWVLLLDQLYIMSILTCFQDDIGLGTVVGSAVYNVMFVISVCALAAGMVSIQKLSTNQIFVLSHICLILQMLFVPHKLVVGVIQESPCLSVHLSLRLSLCLCKILSRLYLIFTLIQTTVIKFDINNLYGQKVFHDLEPRYRQGHG